MRVLNVNSSIDPKAGGGAAERTFQMSRFLSRQGIKCTVLTINTDLEQARVSALAPATIVALFPLWKRFYVPRTSWKTIRRLVDESDIVHLMAHWSILNAIVYFAIRLAGKPYVVCPVGTLPFFGRSVWLKCLYNFIVGNAIIQNASAWIAVTVSEFSHFERYGISSSRVTVIPNGVCEEDFLATDNKTFLAQRGLPDAPIILFMGRLNLIKGPDLLLEAFILARHHLIGYQLVFAGPDEGMLPKLREVVEREGLTERVHFMGYICGTEKTMMYRSAKILVVSSRQEAMSIVALESGICGTPVLVTNQCGFSDICMVDPRLEVPATANGISEGLVRLLAEEDTLKALAPAWRNFVIRRYAWKAIAPQYIKIYRGILATI